MSSVATVFGAARLAFDRVVIGFNAIASGWIFVIMILISIDILLRYLFSAPLRGVTEIVEISIIFLVWLQAADAVRTGRLTRSDALYSKLLRQAPRIGNFLGGIFNLCGAALMVAILVGSWPKFISAYEGGYYVGNVGVFTFPEWPQRLALVVGAAAMAIQFLILSIDNLRTVLNGPAGDGDGGGTAADLNGSPPEGESK